MKFSLGRLASVLAFSAVVGSALANPGGTTRVIYSNNPASATSLIPGLGGLRFSPGTATQFDRVYVSANGNHWMLRALSDEAATADDMIITGTGILGSTGVVRIKEGTAAPWNASLLITTVRQQMGINNSGNFAFATDTNAATTADDFVVRWNGSSYEVMANEGQTIPGSGLGFGSTNDSVHIMEDGSIRFRSSFLVGATADDAFISLTGPGVGSLDYQTSSYTPSGQLTTPQIADVFSAGTYRTAPDASVSIFGCDMLGATTSDYVTMVNHLVSGQEGFPLPGSAFTSNVTSMDTAAGTRTVANNGHYAFRGSNIDTIDFVVVDGSVAAQTDAPIYSGAAENFDDTPFAACFFANTVAANGSYVIGGTTNNTDATKNAVMILNNSYEILREGDPVDVNGNGLFDDNAFISVFNNDDCVLTSDHRYYFMADLKDNVGASLGQAFMVKQLGSQPISYNIVSGSYFGGNEASLCFSDDDQLFILNEETQPNGIVEFVIPTAYTSATKMNLTTELSSTRDDLAVFIDFKNQTNSAFEVKEVFNSEFLDTVRHFELNSAANYINMVTGNVDVRLRWIPAEDLIAEDGWSERVDLVSLLVQP